MSITMLAVEPPATGSALGARARELTLELSELVRGVDAGTASDASNAPDALDGAEAAALAVTFGELERLAAAGKTLSAGRVAATGHHRVLSFPSAARWLADVTNVGVGEAGQVIATAAHLGDAGLSPTRAAMVAGSLTGAQASEIARTAAGAPGEQERLLRMAARETTAVLRDECRKVRLAGRPTEGPEARRRRVAEEMALGTRDLGDGMAELFARMPSAWLVLVMAAVREQGDVIFKRARADGRNDPHAAYLVEALVTLLLLGNLGGDGSDPDDDDGVGGPDAADPTDAADAVDDDGVGEVDLADEVDDDDGNDAAEQGASEPDFGDDGVCGGAGFDDPLYGQLLASIWGGPPPAPPPRAQRRRMRRGRCACGGRVAPRAKIIARVDQAALLRGWVEGGETCEIAGVGPVPVSTVRELWPDAVVKLVVTRGTDVVNVTHLGRRATEAMATAMQWASVRCTNVACDNDRFVEVDHRLGWANVHRTRVDELDGLCAECHRWKTNDNWQLVRGRGRRRFVPPDHPDHPGDPPTPRRRD
jgi:hypothetical protein